MGEGGGYCLSTFQAAPLFQIVKSGILGNSFPPPTIFGTPIYPSYNIAVSVILQYPLACTRGTDTCYNYHDIIKISTYKFYQ